MATSCMQEGNGFRSSFSDCHNSGAPVFFGSRAFPAHAAPSCAMKNSALLLISCPDRRGEVATLAHFVYRRGGSILHADAGADEESALFLMRVEFDPKDFDIDLSQPDLSGFGKQFFARCGGVRDEMAAGAVGAASADDHLRFEIRSLPARSARSPAERRNCAARLRRSSPIMQMRGRLHRSTRSSTKSRAVRAHVENPVIVHGNETVLF
jgi:hypothetical protein